MKNERNVSVADSAAYTVLMFLSNLAGTIALLVVMFILKKAGAEALGQRSAVLFIPLFALISTAGALVVTSFYFRYKMPNIVPKRHTGNAERKVIFGDFIPLVLPAEILRAVLSLFSAKPGHILGFGYRFFDGIFAFAPNFVYDQIYLTPHGRLESIREYGYTAQDNAVFAAVYLAYFVLNLVLLYLLFEKVWRKYEEERNSEIKITMDPEQMK